MDNVVKIMLVSFVTNLVLAVSKIVVGIVGFSSALIADGIHSFSDLITDIIAIIGNNMAKKPADLKHPYGHGKIEYITSFAIGIIIILLGFGLISEMINKEVTTPNMIVIIVSFIVIIVKLNLSTFLLRKGKKLKNCVLIASGKESATDVISSIIVLVSAILSQFNSPYFIYADKVASIIIGIFIIRIGFEIVKENMSSVIGEQEEDKTYLAELNKIILNFTNIKEVRELVILKYGSYYKLISDVAMDGNITLEEAHSIIDEVEIAIKNYDDKIMYINIHMSPYVEEKTKKPN